ncbi:RNHCP domain-containing protein [Frankia sp. Cppng1_Ct_nod]|uniref:RNHCP domain-containing protein n=1 Tax=Frankia sp. Cppng1_Ct_nod TaxID=2897162 RepID=UPI0020250AB5|nr:RNHCP domain-containing protein [Frankia sp. Cppng1_Ct_nod]
MSRRFARTTEDFACLRCGTSVRGDGYTNHCPCCLWSRHVDVNPGDRVADCRGLMRPIAVEVRTQGAVLTHRCESCGHERRNRTSPADDIETVMRVSAEGGGQGGGRSGAAAPPRVLRGRGPSSDGPRRPGRPR